jgi:acetyltransferase-like isoleucine patch superfamily enzyme
MIELEKSQKFENYNYPLNLFAKTGEDVAIHKFVEIKHPESISIGSHVAIDFGFFITTGAIIGDYIHIGPYVSVIGGKKALLELQSLSSVAAGVRFICLGDEHLGEGIVGALIPEKFQDKRIGGKITVEKYAAIGTNAIVMPGVTIREGSVIGANALIKHDTEPWTIYVGSPAKAIKLRPKSKILEFAAAMGY